MATAEYDSVNKNNGGGTLVPSGGMYKFRLFHDCAVITVLTGFPLTDNGLPEMGLDEHDTYFNHSIILAESSYDLKLKSSLSIKTNQLQ